MILVPAIFLTVTLGVALTFQVLAGVRSRQDKVRQRLSQEFKRDSGSAPPSPLFKKLDPLSLSQAVNAEQLRGDTQSAIAVNPASLSQRLEALLQQANVPFRPEQLLGLAGLAGLGTGALGFWLAGVWVGLGLAVVGAAVPLVVVYLRRNARREKFLQQLPGAFDLMARVIRAGQSVPQALQSVADAFDEPIATEFLGCQKQQTFGLSPEVSFRDMAQRSGILELRIFVMALLIQRQTGGSLAEVLERLANLVRARLRLRQHVRTLTAEGRLQGLTLIVLPFVVFAAMWGVNRRYAELLLEQWHLLVVMAIAMLAGVVWIRRIVHFEV